MLVHDNQYLETLCDLLKEAKEASMAVAFWGEDSETIFDGYEGKPPRIICNLALGGTNPKAIRELKTKWKNAKIRQLDNLHAKLVLTEKAMIVGSANISSNGLGLEDGEVAGFRELGIRSEDAEQLKAARTWFDELWENEAREIDDSDLDAAQRVWKKRRSARPSEKVLRSRNLLDQPASVLKDSEIYFVIYRNGWSKKVKEIVGKKQAENIRTKHEKLDAYETVKGFPKVRNVAIIPIYWGANGAIKIDNTQKTKGSPPDKDGGGNSDSLLDFTVMDRKFRPDPFSFTPSHRRELENNIKPWLESIRDQFLDEYYAGCVPVYKFLKWRETQQPG